MVIGAELLARARGQLLRDLARVSDESVALEPEAGTRTIAESLLHIAAFEFVLAVAMATHSGGTIPVKLWEEVKAGFATEVGYDPPRGLKLSDCEARLGKVRRFMREVMDDGDSVLGDDHLRIALERLHEGGADIDNDRIVKLQHKLASHFGDLPVSVILMAHEEFHRGQILLQNYVAKHAGAVG